MKKNFLMLFAATALMLGAVMFSSCSKDEDDAVKANAAAQNNPVATLNATVEEVDAIMSQYDFRELQPLMSALSQTDKASKGPIKDFFVNGRNKIRVFDSIARNRLFNMLKNMVPSYERPFEWQGALTNSAETFSLAWNLTAYLSNGNTLFTNVYDTIYVVAEDSSVYRIYAQNRNSSSLSLKNREFGGASLLTLIIEKDDVEVLSFLFGVSGDYSQGAYNNLVAGQMNYKDLNVIMGLNKKSDSDYRYRLIISNENEVIVTANANIAPEGTIRERIYPTEFTMTLLPDTRNVEFVGTITDLKAYVDYYKTAKEMRTNGGTKEDCDALVANLNEASTINMSIASNHSAVTFTTTAVEVEGETVYQPVMMIQFEGAHYPMTLKYFFDYMGINILDLLAALRQS
ncbi:MAG: hypothetical protein IJU90_05485 [Bacteroidales bacterium]|nr:hypothetical protein [Bacteroidales bacterium]